MNYDDHLQPPEKPDWIEIAEKILESWDPVDYREQKLFAVIEGLLEIIADETGLIAKAIPGTTGPF